MNGWDGAVIKIGQKYNSHTMNINVKARRDVSTRHGARSQPPAKPRVPLTKYNIYVRILDNSGSVLHHGIDIVALRRFSYAARTALTRANRTTNLEEASIDYTLPSSGNEAGRAPSMEAVQAVVFWMMGNQHVAERPLPITESEVGTSLHSKVEVLGVCHALNVARYPRMMSRNVIYAIRQAPVDVELLATIFELLPHDHEVLLAAVQSLTHFYRFGQIHELDNELLEDYICQKELLLEMFNAEMERQRKLHGRFKKRQSVQRGGGRGKRVAETQLVESTQAQVISV